MLIETTEGKTEGRHFSNCMDATVTEMHTGGPTFSIEHSATFTPCTRSIQAGRHHPNTVYCVFKTGLGRRGQRSMLIQMVPNQLLLVSIWLLKIAGQ